jgi:hypothetical protein
MTFGFVEQPQLYEVGHQSAECFKEVEVMHEMFQSLQIAIVFVRAN